MVKETHVTLSLPKGMKQTESGLIPKDWVVGKLGSIVSFQNGAAHEQLESETGDFIVVNSKFISTEGRVYRRVIKDILPLKVNDITIVMSDIPNGKALAKCYLIERDNLYTLNQRIGKITTTTESAKYLFYVLNRNKYYLSFDSGSGQTNLRKQEVLDCKIPLPPLAEQEAIAAALSDCDAWIESVEAVIAKKRLIKQGAMQELLTPKEDWEVKKLGEISEIIIGLTYSPNDVRDFGTLVLRSSNVQNNKLAFENNVFVQMDLPQRVIVKEDDILVCVRNGSKNLIGKCALIDKKTEGQAFGAFMSIIRSQFGKYLFHYFQTNHIQVQIDENLGATINQLTNATLKSFDINIPISLSEQTRIATVLSDMDAELEALGQKLNKARQIKQGMMQELLTGRVRLV